MTEKIENNYIAMIRYELQVNKLQVSYEIKNTGITVLYFSIGAHPGFVCPLDEQEQFSDYYLEFEKPETLDRHLLSDGLFNGKTELVLNEEKILPLEEELFGKDAIVFKNMRSSFMLLKSRKSDHALKFSFTNFPYFGIWTKPGARFICLEPWCGMADNLGFKGELKEKEGIETLEAGEIFRRAYSVEI